MERRPQNENINNLDLENQEKIEQFTKDIYDIFEQHQNLTEKNINLNNLNQEDEDFYNIVLDKSYSKYQLKKSSQDSDFHQIDKIFDKIEQMYQENDTDFINNYSDYYTELIFKQEQRNYLKSKENETTLENRKKWFSRIVITLLITGSLYFGADKIFNEQEEAPLDNQHQIETNIKISTVENFEDIKNKNLENQEAENTKEVKIIKDVEATSYCPCEKCCGEYAKNRPIDQNGKPIVEVNGHILKPHNPNQPENIFSAATDPKVISTGSIFELRNKNGDLVGTFEAVDTGSAVNGKIVDIFTDSHKQALINGRMKDLEAIIISEPEEKQYKIVLKTHKIASGESLSSIAKKYNTSVSEILKNNQKITNSNAIKENQELIIPAKVEIEN